MGKTTSWTLSANIINDQIEENPAPLGNELHANALWCVSLEARDHLQAAGTGSRKRTGNGMGCLNKI
jgi:hypothetical protein